MPHRPISPPSQAAAGTRSLAMAGTAGLTAFVTVSLVHSLLRPDHALLSDGISALGAGSTGWIQGLTFLVSGLLVVVFAIGVFGALRSGVGGTLGAVLIAAFGIGVIGLAVFPATDAEGRYVTDRVLHNLSALSAFSGAALAPFALAWHFAGAPFWRPLTKWMLGAGILLVVLHLGSLALVVPPTAPLHEWLGLSQWLFVAVWCPAMILVGSRMMRAAES